METLPGGQIFEFVIVDMEKRQKRADKKDKI